jgi:hypothetical protein
MHFNDKHNSACSVIFVLDWLALQKTDTAFPPNRQFTFNRLNCFISQKTQLVITTTGATLTATYKITETYYMQ